MAAFKAASFRMESGIWFFTKRFGRGLVEGVGGGCCTNRSEAALSVVSSMVADRTSENVYCAIYHAQVRVSLFPADER